MSTAAATPFEEVLSAGGPPVRRLMADVELLLGRITVAYGTQLGRAAGTTLAGGGKRLRPLLVFVCVDGEHGSQRRRQALVRAAAAVELVHMASLVHDDVLDDARVRRGRPTVYASQGRGTATASGDFLFSRAFSLLGENGNASQIRALSDACVDLARGELAQRRDAYSHFAGVERYLYRCELKTASLFVAACKLGALVAGYDGPQVEALGRFGQRVGLAFQILDDVLDVAGDVVQTGKQRGSDLLEGTVTLPLILAAEADPELAKLDLSTLNSRAEAERVCERIAASGALEEARRQASELVVAAQSELDGGLDSRVSALLRLVADRVVDRYS
jgi:geranylgeranyl pyrophosphate synthase